MALGRGGNSTLGRESKRVASGREGKRVTLGREGKRVAPGREGKGRKTVEGWS